MRYSILKIDKTVRGFTMGKGTWGRFCLTLNPDAEDFAYRAADFIRYENAHGRKIRLKPRSFDPSGALKRVPESGSVRRPGDPLFVVHKYDAGGL